jgi:hypothetical protein
VRTSGALFASGTSIIRWHGWRPLPLDMVRNQQGGQVFLVLDREGDLALLPTASIAYLCNAPLDGRETRPQDGLDPVEVIYSAATDRGVIERAVAEMEADGWEVTGRLQATFQGVDTEDDFWSGPEDAGAAEGTGAREVTR